MDEKRRVEDDCCFLWIKQVSVFALSSVGVLEFETGSAYFLYFIITGIVGLGFSTMSGCYLNGLTVVYYVDFLVLSLWAPYVVVSTVFYLTSVVFVVLFVIVFFLEIALYEEREDVQGDLLGEEGDEFFVEL